MGAHELPEFDRLLPVAEVARRLSVSRAFVYTLMDRGNLDYLKIGKCRRIRPEDLARLIEASAVRRATDGDDGVSASCHRL